MPGRAREPLTTTAQAAPSFADDLEGTRAEAFRLLSRGVADRRSAFHTPTVATLGTDGRPRMRTVVLRAFDPAARTLRFHTDARSEKVADLLRDPRVCVHGYDVGGKVQIRLEGRAAAFAMGDLVDAAWSGSQPMSRLGYGAQPAPGTESREPITVTFPAGPDEAEAGRVHFRVVVVTFDRLEWLWLDHRGHRRALFDWAGGETPRAVWLAP